MGYKNGQGLRFGMTYSIIKVKRFNENEVRGLEREREIEDAVARKIFPSSRV